MATSDKIASFSVAGQTAIVTGGGSGIGLCFVEILLSRKCNVVIADLALRPEAQSVVDAHSAKDPSKPRAIFIKADVRNWDDLNNCFEVTDQEFGRADIICPSAGIFEPHWSNFWHPPGTAESKDSPHGVGHYATLDINLQHPIRMTQLALIRWLRSDSPSSPRRVVHVSSIAAQGTSLGVPLYNASKAAISSFVRCLGDLDAAFNIRVTAVAPAVIRTPLWTEHPEKLQMFDADRDNWVEPADVAAEMLKCCEDPDIPGGSVLEVTGQGLTRRVEVLNDPGTDIKYFKSTLSKSEVLKAEVLKWLSGPGWGSPV